MNTPAAAHANLDARALASDDLPATQQDHFDAYLLGELANHVDPVTWARLCVKAREHVVAEHAEVAS